jgi:hypothetical protein
VKKKIERCLRIKKKEWSHERKRKENLEREKVKRSFLADQPMIFLVYKESYLNLDETNQSFPSLVVSLLQEFDDVFPKEMPSGLPPIRALSIKLISYLEPLFQTD